MLTTLGRSPYLDNVENVDKAVVCYIASNRRAAVAKVIITCSRVIDFIANPVSHEEEVAWRIAKSAQNEVFQTDLTISLRET